MIRIKGLRDGLLVQCGGESWPQDYADLESKLSMNPAFFKGGHIAIDAKDFALGPRDLESLDRLLSLYDVRLTAIVTRDQATQRMLDELAIPTALPAKPAAAAAPPQQPVERAHVDTAVDNSPDTVDKAVDNSAAATVTADLSEGVVVRRRMRTGQIVKHPGHITVIGDVNPGATLIAGGDIIVWGRLQGTVHAGAFGDAGAVVYALQMSPSVIRIADNVQLSTNRRKTKASGPEIAYVQDNEIVIAGWDTQHKLRGA